ncbi:MAG: photosynthetic complex assembly protein [Pseudomonadota bacterium]|jgi:MFS transporter, BCD family, chlorophyll transporter
MMRTNPAAPMGWFGIFRLGLVQAAIGAIVVITTSTLNRVLVVELALPAMLPGILVALHYFVQVLRPRLGYGSDVGGRRTPWIIGGMAVLGLGALGAVLSAALMVSNLWLGIACAVVAFLLVGLGVGACGTTMLVLLAKSVAKEKLAAAATVTWVMMIVGFIVTTVIAGKMLDPFSLTRLVEVTASVAAAAFLVTCLAVYGLERPAVGSSSTEAVNATTAATDGSFIAAFREVWAEPHSRRLASFVFVSMLAYSAQDLILEPFAGAVFGMTPGESTQLSGMMSGGTLVGMMLVALICTVGARSRMGALRLWTIGGCVASALMLVTLAVAGFVGPAWPLAPTVFLLGLANGAYAVAAIGSMMGLVGRGRESREGTRMGLWGAAQAIAFGIGGIAATGAVDLARALTGSLPAAYGSVFVAEAALFVLATAYAVRLSREDTQSSVQVDIQGVSATYVTEAGRG